MAYTESVMRQETTTRTLYRFSELSPEAQARAIEKRAQAEGEFFDGDFVIDGFVELVEAIGFDVARYDAKTYGGGTITRPRVWWSGFWRQGDGACFEGTYTYRKGALTWVKENYPKDDQLHRIVQELQDAQKRCFYGLRAGIKHRGPYMHYNSIDISIYFTEDEYRDVPREAEEAVDEAIRNLCKWLYAWLEDEYEYVTSEAHARDYFKDYDGDHEFTEDGDPA